MTIPKFNTPPRSEESQFLDRVKTDASNLDSPPKAEPHKLRDFLAWVRSAGIHKNNRFFVDINFPPGASIDGNDIRDALLACEEIAIPNRQLQTRSLRLGGLTERRASTLDYGNEFTLTFLVDNTHRIQDLFENWMNVAVNQTTRYVGEYAEYAKPVVLWFLRPTNPSEVYQPIRSGRFERNSFLGQAQERVLNAVASQIGQYKNQATAAIRTARDELLGSQLGTYQRIKQLLPLEYLDSTPTDVGMYYIEFREAFPTQISRSVLSHGSTDVSRLTVTFSFKEYRTRSTSAFRPTTDQNQVLTFIKRVGIPTTRSELGRAVLDLL